MQRSSPGSCAADTGNVVRNSHDVTNRLLQGDGNQSCWTFQTLRPPQRRPGACNQASAAPAPAYCPQTRYNDQLMTEERLYEVAHLRLIKLLYAGVDRFRFFINQSKVSADCLNDTEIAPENRYQLYLYLRNKVNGIAVDASVRFYPWFVTITQGLGISHLYISINETPAGFPSATPGRAARLYSHAIFLWIELPSHPIRQIMVIATSYRGRGPPLNSRTSVTRRGRPPDPRQRASQIKSRRGPPVPGRHAVHINRMICQRIYGRHGTPWSDPERFILLPVKIHTVGTM